MGQVWFLYHHRWVVHTGFRVIANRADRLPLQRRRIFQVSFSALYFVKGFRLIRHYSPYRLDDLEYATFQRSRKDKEERGILPYFYCMYVLLNFSVMIKRLIDTITSFSDCVGECGCTEKAK
jgi:hypothetical protein